MAEQQNVILPTSVENLIDSICKEQNQLPPDAKLRRQLAAIGEQQALHILSKISKNKIRHTLSAFILHMLKQQSLPLSPSPPNPTRPPHSSLLHALGELEFRKAFLLLSYAGGECLENVTTAEYIRSLKDLPMATFEKTVWEAVGQKCVNRESDRRLYVDWDSGKSHVYHCYVSSDGNLRFKGPILQSMRTHLQKCLGDENVLLVKFDDDRSVRNVRTSAEEANALYGKFGKEGICVGLRLYRFFVFKDGGKEEKKKDPTTSSVKCYFVRIESYCSVDESASYVLSNKTMFEARSLFMHVHTLPSLDKYMARFSLILSKTLKLDIDLATVSVKTIQDEYCKDENGNIVYDNGKPRILTDGTGFISEDLALLCPNNVSKGTSVENKYIQEIRNLVELEDMSKAMIEAKLNTHQLPLLIQCRLFHMGSAMKGTLLVNRKLPPRTIQVRPSMIKVETDSSLPNIQTINSMEVVTTSNKPNRAYLSRQLITLLSYGGVPNEFFMGILRSNLEDADLVYTKKRAALRASINHGEMDEYNAAGMILCGIPLDETFLQYRLSILAKAERKRLRGGKLYVPDCFYLMGTVDPTGSLKKNQVCIIHENGQITGDVLVYRNPGLHFGDIHVMHARSVEGLESFVGHSKYAIFFPCVGPRSVADEIAGGDFDGDMYWVSKHPELLQYFRKSDPWIERSSVRLDSNVRKPSAFSAEELEEELFRLYLETRFQPSSTMGVAADSCVALMDRLLTLRNDCSKENEKEHVKENILKLIDIYYVALDAPKKGGRKIQVPKDLAVEMFPHYMEKDRSFTSTSILGLIYDEVSRWQTKDISMKEIRKLSCFDIEVPSSCMQKWETLYEEYRKDMTNALKDNSRANDEAAEVIRIYKEKLYGAANMEDSPKNIRDIYNEALAVYHVTYNYAIQTNSVSKCSFAWTVAGSALTSLYTIKQNEKALNSALSVLREIFGS
ncbi:probable RNA-dependent RNA polymerase 3 isoform X2 [Abrus precatorius]|uniref:RNA-dependent RNA polymerase n=1 Tax=Abrus precatorius TaxID=3816 RepID=A0A8B8LQ18_ABRPR|nr:probable RNA-dependent RNA polymerase 3 isoform X2 [Abrus precatorius]